MYDNRRGWSGDPIEGAAAWRAGIERYLAQYSHHEGRILSVRGERLALARSLWSDDAGNETAHLHVIDVVADGRIEYHGRFDEDDFEGAYHELERRYYVDEGAAFAAGGAVPTDYIMGINRGDLDRVFGELSTRDFRATCCVVRQEREAVGLDGEGYSWTRLYTVEVRGGRVASMCEFELERRYYAGEGAAFAVGGALQTAYVTAQNRGELGRDASQLLAPDFRWTSRSLSVFGNRSATEYVASVEELAAMVASVRAWISALHWLSPTICVVRTEREGVGTEGEQYTWKRLYTSGVRGGLLASMCEFELESEEAAFAYAESLVTSPSSTDGR